MKSICFLLWFLAVMPSSTAQPCVPVSPKDVSSSYEYIQAELKALRWIRSALIESSKISPIPSELGPKRMRKAINFYGAVQAMSDDYDCAAEILTPFKDSGDETIRNSAKAILGAIDSSKVVNSRLIGVMESVDKAKVPDDIDAVAIAKTLDESKSIQGDAMALTLAGTRMSTFGILSLNQSNSVSIAFTITSRQKGVLLAKVHDLEIKSSGHKTYVDACADIMLAVLLKHLPTSDEGTSARSPSHRSALVSPVTHK